MSGTGAAFVQGTGAAFVQGVGAARGAPAEDEGGSGIWWCEATATSRMGANDGFTSTILDSYATGTTYKHMGLDGTDTYSCLDTGTGGNTLTKFSGQVTSTIKTTLAVGTKGEGGLTYLDGDTIVTDAGFGPKAFVLAGVFSTTVLDSCLFTTHTGAYDPEPDVDNFTIYAQTPAYTYLYSGHITSTVKATQYYGSNPRGVTWDGADTIHSLDNGKFIRGSGQVDSNTIRESHAWNLDGNGYFPRHLEWGNYSERYS